MLLGLCVASDEQSLERNVIFVGAFFLFYLFRGLICY